MKLLKRLPRVVLLLLDLAVFCFFFYPVTYGLLDLSNAVVMSACFLVALVLLFPRQTGRLLRRIWSKRLGKAILLILGALVLLVAVLLTVLMIRVLSRMHDRPKQDCKTLIVLGCMVDGETPSVQLCYRIEAAADYLLAHPDAVAVLSGGQGRGERMSEADCMFRELTARGVAPDRLYREAQSSNTRENLTNSMALIRQADLQGPVAIVSNNFHIYRALRMAGDLGFSAEGLAARSQPASLPFSVFREAMALVKYALS